MESPLKKCKRCKSAAATIESRTELFCNDCFAKFVCQKGRKRMMSNEFYRDHFKVLYGKDKNSNIKETPIVFPFDFSAPSLTSMDIMCGLMKEQRRQHRGRVGFRVYVVTVFRDITERDLYRDMWSRMHEENDRMVDEDWKQFEFHLIDANKFFNDGTRLMKITLNSEISECTGVPLEADKSYTISELMKSCVDKSARGDMWKIIVRHFVKNFAYQHKDVELIFWSDSMTRLANEVLGLIIKGRGSQIARRLDMNSFDEDYDCQFKSLYALKDILLTELNTYCYITGINKFIIGDPPRETVFLDNDTRFPKEMSGIKLAKNMTISELVGKYFDDVEADYSNVISTVLRMGDKIVPPNRKPLAQKCAICSNLVYIDPHEWTRSTVVATGHPVETEEEKMMYTRWLESKASATETSGCTERCTDKGANITLCYGCIVNLSGTKDKTIIWPKNSREELEETLKEYVLDDED